jgi:hypothetical protein
LQRSPEIGDFVEVRGRPWLVEGIDDKGGGLSALQLSCISDDAQGEALEVAWDADIGARRLEDDFWSRLRARRHRRSGGLRGISSDAQVEHGDRGGP